MASPQPMQLGQKKRGKPQDRLLSLPSEVTEMVKGRPTACVMVALGYLARISFSIRLRLFINHPPVGQLLMQICWGAALIVLTAGLTVVRVGF